MIKLGPQLYTAREYTQTPEGIEKTFRICRENNYETVQISGFGPMPIDQMTALLEKYEIDVCCTHSPFDRMKEDLDTLIEEHKRMNTSVIGLGAMSGDYRQTPEGVYQFVEDIKPIAERIKKAGLQFAYHNHNFEFQRMADGRLVMDVLMEDTDPELFHFIPDTYWLQMGGVNPAEYLRRMKGRVEVCHFKDFAVDGFTPVFAEVGCGNINLLECFKACQEIGVQSIVIEQDVCHRDPFDCLQNSYKNLMAIAKQAGDR